MGGPTDQPGPDLECYAPTDLSSAGSPSEGHPADLAPTADEEPTGDASAGLPDGSVEESTDGDEPSAVDEAVEQAEEAIAEDVSELAHLTLERDEYLNQLRRLQADFENYKKRVVKQQAEHQERATQDLVTKLLAVLDNFDLAVAHGSDDVQPVYRSLLDVLEASGLERIDPSGEPFDPNEHDAVMHEPGDGDPAVIEVLRAGYRWKGRVLRPAMVKVKG